MVYKLYNLTYEEVKIIDPGIENIISKEAYEKFEIWIKIKKQLPRLSSRGTKMEQGNRF